MSDGVRRVRSPGKLAKGGVGGEGVPPPVRGVPVGDDELSVRNIRGVGPVFGDKLVDAGIATAYELQTRGAAEIREITGCDHAYAVRIVEAGREMLRATGAVNSMFATGDEMAQRAASVERMTTGSKNLDEMFRGDLPEGKGGLETGALTEVYGQYGSGKTQFCLRLIALAQLPRERGGLDTGVVFMDCENIYPFVTERVDAMGQAVGLGPGEVRRRLMVATPNNSDQAILALDRVEELMRGGSRVVVVDGAMSHFRSDYGVFGREGYPKRAKPMTAFFNRLKRMAAIHNAVVVISNQVRFRPDGFGDPVEPVGGSILAHTSTYRVYFKKVSESSSKTKVSVRDSPRHSKKDFQVWLSYAGLVDKAPGKFDPDVDGDPAPEGKG